MSNTSALTPPKEGLDARVGNEMGEVGGWLLRRTKRIEELLAQPAVMEMADRVAEHIDRICVIREVPVKELEIAILPTQTKRYITIQVASDQCVACDGVGQRGDGSMCPTCEGTGRQ